MKTKAKVPVMSDACKTCIYHVENWIERGDVERVVERAMINGRDIYCNSNGDVICKPYFDQQKDNSPVLRLAVALNAIEEVSDGAGLGQDQG